MLKIEDLVVGYGEITVIRGVSISVDAQEVVSLLGANGAGKTTLLKALSGLLEPTQGRIELNGENVAGMPPHEIVERGMVLVPEGRALFPFMSVEENLEVGAHSKRARPHMKKSLEHVYDLLPKLAARRKQISGSMSGGEQQMCAIGRGLMACPKLLLMDEPSLGLAPIIVHEIFKTVERLRSEGITVLLVEQHVKNALRVADKGYVLEGGRIALSGTSAQLMANAGLRSAYMGKNH